MTNYDLDGDDHGGGDHDVDGYGSDDGENLDGDDHDGEDLDGDDHDGEDLDGDYQPVAWAVEIGRSSQFSARGWVQLMTLERLFSEMAPSLKSGSELFSIIQMKNY